MEEEIKNLGRGMRQRREAGMKVGMKELKH
jgi:hypothetical protein